MEFLYLLAIYSIDRKPSLECPKMKKSHFLPKPFEKIILIMETLLQEILITISHTFCSTNLKRLS